MAPMKRPPFSWSVSRRSMFDSCRRNYWFNYYGYWNGWFADEDPLVQKLYMLKNRTNLWAWIGNSTHEAVARYLSEDRDVDAVVAWMQARMRVEFARSQRREFRKPRSSKLFGLIEHEESDGDHLEFLERALERVALNLQNFARLPVVAAVDGARQSGLYVRVEEAELDFVHDAVKARLDDLPPVTLFGKPDLAYEWPRGCLNILDWKTGMEPSTERIRGLLFQLGTYAAWFQFQRAKPENAKVLPTIDSFDVRAVYLPSGRYHGGLLPLEAMGEVEARIGQSVGSMIDLVQGGDLRQNVVRKQDCPPTPSERGCSLCNFRSVCEAYVGP